MENLVEPKTIYFHEDAHVPNNPHLPVLIYRQVLDRQHAEKDKEFQRHFEESGWRGMWKGFIYDYHHFHPDTHEALAIAEGHVTLMLGGPSGKSIGLEAGDLIVLPAGTGHKMMSSSENLVVVGAYPPGLEGYRMCQNLSECPQVVKNIANLPLPSTDPFYGKSGPLPHLWH